MPQRQYSREQSRVSKANPRVILPIARTEYEQLASEPQQFRRWLDEMITTYAELFPVEIEAGYTLHDILPASAKLPDVRWRRIKLKGGAQQVLTICSSDVMPYMTGYTDEVEKALFLRRFGVPFWGLTYVFGRNDDYWYNMTGHFGRYAIVGTVVKDPEQLPSDLLADEKHVHFNGEKGYIAANGRRRLCAGCIAGARRRRSGAHAGLWSLPGRGPAGEARLPAPNRQHRRLVCDPECLASALCLHRRDSVLLARLSQDQRAGQAALQGRLQRYSATGLGHLPGPGPSNVLPSDC